MTIKVFNADDHPMLRKGITDLIVETPGLEWVGSAENGIDALEKIINIQPDVAILDIEMPHLTGLEVARQLIEGGSRTNIILLTLFKDESFLKNAIKIGVKGYLLKESSEKEILDCIRSANVNKVYVNPTLMHLLLSDKKDKSHVLDALSKHEVNILKLISRNKTSAEIADMLFISVKTVANHRNNISKKLNLKGEQNGLLKWAIEHKHLLEPR
jgi:DNA-binding NarL/FixJ family response regulator